LTHYATGFTLENLALTDSVLNDFKVWQLFTYSFISGGCGLLFNGCIVLFLGSAIEREWKTRATFLLTVTVIVTCGITWILFNLLLGRNNPGMGSGAMAYGFIGAFGILFRKQRFLAFLWTVEAQTIAWILIAIGIVFGIASPITWIWVGGALVAYAVTKAKWGFAVSREQTC
jgi:membrane associated rhomboid family serine protease